MSVLELDLRGGWDGFQIAAAGRFEISGVTALFGPSGAGKSTVLHAIAGFRPDLGTVRYDGALWQGGATRATPAHRRPVGLVFQEARLFEHLSVDGNLRFAERRADPTGPAIERDAVIETLDIADLLARRVHGLSGGEARRVAIARALLGRPKLLLMDEPLSGLDRARKAAILPLIQTLPARFGAPVLFVSHLVDEIAQISERLIAMRDGAITRDGPAIEMLERLAPEITGRFEAGALIEGRYVGYDAAYDLAEIAIGEARLMAPGRPSVQPGERVRLRFRARDVSIARERLEGLSIRNQLPARVIEIRPESGAYAEVALALDGQRLLARIARQSIDALALKPGEEVVALVKTTAFDRRLGVPRRAADPEEREDEPQ